MSNEAVYKKYCKVLDELFPNKNLTFLKSKKILEFISPTKIDLAYDKIKRNKELWNLLSTKKPNLVALATSISSVSNSSVNKDIKISVFGSNGGIKLSFYEDIGRRIVITIVFYNKDINNYLTLRVEKYEDVVVGDGYEILDYNEDYIKNINKLFEDKNFVKKLMIAILDLIKKGKITLSTIKATKFIPLDYVELKLKKPFTEKQFTKEIIRLFIKSKGVLGLYYTPWHYLIIMNYTYNVGFFLDRLRPCIGNYICDNYKVLYSITNLIFDEGWEDFFEKKEKYYVFLMDYFNKHSHGNKYCILNQNAKKELLRLLDESSG